MVKYLYGDNILVKKISIIGLLLGRHLPVWYYVCLFRFFPFRLHHGIIFLDQSMYCYLHEGFPLKGLSLYNLFVLRLFTKIIVIYFTEYHLNINVPRVSKSQGGRTYW